MPDDPLKLSVTLCNYNDAATLPRAIEAILGQTRPPDELVLIDDGSTDDSFAIMTRYAAASPVVRVLRNETNRGILFSGNRVVRETTGDFVYCASADDYVLPDFFERALRLLARHPEAGLAFGCIIHKAKASGAETPVRVPAWTADGYRSRQEFLRDYLESGEMWSSLSPAGIFRRQPLMEAGGFLPELDAFCDTFAANALGLKFGVCYLHEPCTVFFTGGEAYSARLYRDPPRLIEVIRRTVSHMRAQPSVFPTDYVARWEQVRLDGLLHHLCAQLREHVWSARCLADSVAPAGRSLPALLHRLASAATIRLGEARLRRAIDSARVARR